MKVDLERVAKYQRAMPWLIVLQFVLLGANIADRVNAFGIAEPLPEKMSSAETAAIVVVTLVGFGLFVASYALSITVTVLLLAAMRQSLQLRVVAVFTMIIPIAAIVNLIWFNQWAKRLLREGAAQSDEAEAEAT